MARRKSLQNATSSSYTISLETATVEWIRTSILSSVRWICASVHRKCATVRASRHMHMSAHGMASICRTGGMMQSANWVSFTTGTCRSQRKRRIRESTGTDWKVSGSSSTSNITHPNCSIDNNRKLSFLVNVLHRHRSKKPSYSRVDIHLGFGLYHGFYGSCDSFFEFHKLPFWWYICVLHAVWPYKSHKEVGP